VINKEGFDEEQIFTAVRNAARSGWESVKFYFMIGLPTETQEDLDEMVRVARESARIARAESARGFGLTVSTSSFVPKPHTPFQWFAMEPMELLKEKQHYLKRKLREANVSYKWHDVESSFLESVFSLGDRSLGRAIHRGYELGCRFDGWTEHLKFDRWMRAFEETGIDPGAIAYRPRGLDEPLPWDHIDIGVGKKFLQREYKKALEVRGTPDCHVAPCSACGEICMPNWPTWAANVGLKVEGARSEVGGAGGKEDGAKCGMRNSNGEDGSLCRLDANVSLSHDPAPRTPHPAPGTPVQRIRFVFQKTGDLRFLSHLEVMKAISRALRRAQVPISYSQGYNPQPKLSFALALPVGVEGRQELADIELGVALRPDELVVKVNQHLSPDLRLLRAWEVPLTAPSLTPSVREVAYQVSLSCRGWSPEIKARIGSPIRCEEWLGWSCIPVTVQRKEKTVEVDARPLINDLRALPEEGGNLRWSLRLRTGQAGSVRPQAIMACLIKGALNGQPDGWQSNLHVARTELVLDGEI
jgi:radical SAM-linked protein